MALSKMKQLVLIVGSLLLLGAAVAAAEEQAATATAVGPSPTPVRPKSNTPDAAAASRDPVIVAVTLAKQLHQQAADATEKAVELAERKNTLMQARRQMLLAAGSLYNSSTQLSRAAKKEQELAANRQLSGEQKGRIVDSLETDEEKAVATRQSKAYLAYAELQSEMAAAMTNFAGKQEGLSKRAETAAKDGDQKTFVAIHKDVEKLVGESKKMYDDVTRDRRKLETMLRD